jgi:hypothetical protein
MRSGSEGMVPTIVPYAHTYGRSTVLGRAILVWSIPVNIYASQ